MHVYAALYLRVSLDHEMDGRTIDRHREDCQRIARERGWTVFREYVDQSISATDKSKVRPGYDAMVADYEAGKFSAIICEDVQLIDFTVEDPLHQRVAELRPLLLRHSRLAVHDRPARPGVAVLGLYLYVIQTAQRHHLINAVLVLLRVLGVDQVALGVGDATATLRSADDSLRAPTHRLVNLDAVQLALTLIDDDVNMIEAGFPSASRS